MPLTFEWMYSTESLISSRSLCRMSPGLPMILLKDASMLTSLSEHLLNSSSSMGDRVLKIKRSHLCLSKILPMSQVQELQAKMLLEDLFYALSGFDTARIYLEGDPVHVATIDYPAPIVEPFAFLIVKVREFYGMGRFNAFVSSYLKKICGLRKHVGTVEELLVGLQEDMEVFRDMDRLNRGEPMDKNGAVHRHFHRESCAKLIESIDAWINLASPGDIVDVGPSEGFSLCFWRDCFRLKDINLSREEMAGIEDCGKIVFFIRAVFGMEVIDDSPEDSQKPPKRRSPPKSPCKRADGSMPSDPGTPDIGSYSWCGEAQVREGAELPILPLHYAGSIRARRDELHGILNTLVSDRVSSEVSRIHSVVYMQNFTMFLGLFEELGQDLLSSKPISRRINDCLRGFPLNESQVSLELCDAELGEYVLKLLKHHRVPQPNQYLLNLQRVSVLLGDGMLRYFVPGRAFVEMKIIFRLLFSLSAIMYYLERSDSYNFTKVIYLVFMRLRSVSIEPVEYSGSIDTFVADFTAQVSGLLSSFYLTNAEIFVHLSGLIDVGYEYLQIEHKEHVDAGEYNSRVKGCVAGLLAGVLKHHGDCDFTEFLRSLNVDRCLG